MSAKLVVAPGKDRGKDRGEDRDEDRDDRPVGRDR